MRRDRQLFNQLIHEKIREPEPSSAIRFRNRFLDVALTEDLEYVHNVEGRCSNHRSRGKMSSILLRNVKFGAEMRIFTSNPSVVVECFRKKRRMRRRRSSKR